MKKNLEPDEIRNLINKKLSYTATFHLKEENPTDVKGWIPTSSRWLDSIIARGKMAGIPVGKITEIAGLEHAGKSFLAAFIARNAQKLGIKVVWFDSEMAVDSEFLSKIGMDLEQFIYIPANTVEDIFEVIEMLMQSGDKYLFIWDSLALTPTKTETEGGWNPQADMARKARVINLCLSKILVPLAKNECTMIVLNHLKDKIGAGLFDPEKYSTPGGKTLTYAYCLRIWLTLKKGKSNLLMDSEETPIGSESKVVLKKSRFGTYNRSCTMKMIWGTETPMMGNEELWLEALEKSEKLDFSKKGWISFNGKSFRKKEFVNTVKTDQEFKKSIEELMDYELIYKSLNNSDSDSNEDESDD